MPKAPILFTKPGSALAGPYPATINIPKCAQDGTSDYESELCAVIGKTGRDISEDDALDHVLGYTASNDVSARNLQFETSQWSFSKGLDNSCPIGQYCSLDHKLYCAEVLQADSDGRPDSCFDVSDQRSSGPRHQRHPQWKRRARWAYQVWTTRSLYIVCCSLLM